MKRIEYIGSLIGLVIAAIVIWQSALIPMGNIGKPGPGFMPFWVAVILALLSGFSWIETRKRKLPSVQVQFTVEERQWSNVIWTAASLLAYGFLIEILGFILSTMFLLLFLFRFMGRQQWWVVFTGSVLVTLTSHAIFKVALKVQLPTGIFKI